MMSDSPDFIIGVQFTRLGKIYHFKANDDRDLVINDYVLVETSRGLQIGRVAQIIQTPGDDPTQINPKSIIRKATQLDLEKQIDFSAKEEETIELCRKALREAHIRDVKIVSIEYGYSGGSLSVLISSLNDEKINIHPIREAINRQFSDLSVNIRQVGPRDVAKIYGGLGACGLPERCCSQFLNEFTSISIRMAKEQEISLTPEEITGMCGRLRCCLIYEYEQYREGRKGLPKKTKWVETPEGIGRVNVVLPLKGTVLVDIPNAGLKEFTGDQVTPAQRPAPKYPPTASPTPEDKTAAPTQQETKEQAPTSQRPSNSRYQQNRGNRPSQNRNDGQRNPNQSNETDQSQRPHRDQRNRRPQKPEKTEGNT